MAVQVSYPGVYIEEFTPGAPIEGVGTNTAAFIGTAKKGPIGEPTLITSWDAFKETFGDFQSGHDTGYLAQGVYGFFLNGGTRCYVVRVSKTAAKSHADLMSGTATVIVAEARDEGLADGALTVTTKSSSRLEKALKDAGSSAKGLKAFVADKVKVVAPVSADRKLLTVGSTGKFVVGDTIWVDKSPDKVAAVIASLTAKTITLAGALPGTNDFDVGDVYLHDIDASTLRIRLDVPSGVFLTSAVPPGAMVEISNGTNNEVVAVASSAGSTVVLANPPTKTYDLSDKTKAPEIKTLEFDLTVKHTASGKTEEFPHLGANMQYPAYWGTAVNSQWLVLKDPSPAPGTGLSDPRPDDNTYSLNGGNPDDPVTSWNGLLADPATPLSLIEKIDEVSLVCIPGTVSVSRAQDLEVVQVAMIAHCEKMYDRFAILDPLPGLDLTGIEAQFASVRSALGFAALYYPQIQVRNPQTGKNEMWPPSGHIAGIYARTDQQRGVHKAPANTNIRGALGLERKLTDQEQGPLNLKGINVLRVFPGQSQPVVWGARTTAGDLDRNWQYVNIRRLFLYLEESIQEGIRWAVFEPNDLLLWQKLKRTITEFLTRVWRDGALFGETAEKAFYVRIDEALNPPSTRSLGRLYIEVGVVPTYPAEFIILRIGIWQGGSEVTES